MSNSQTVCGCLWRAYSSASLEWGCPSQRCSNQLEFKSEEEYQEWLAGNFPTTSTSKLELKSEHDTSLVKLELKQEAEDSLKDESIHSATIQPCVLKLSQDKKTQFKKRKKRNHATNSGCSSRTRRRR